MLKVKTERCMKISYKKRLQNFRRNYIYLNTIALNMKDFLTRPYPLFESIKYRLYIAMASALFVFFFLFFIGPFGLYYASRGMLALYSFLYAMITLGALLANFFLIQPLLIKKFNVWKTILWNTWFIFTIGVINCLGVTLPNGFTPNIQIFIIFQGYTFLTGIFISGFIYLVYYIFMLRQKVGIKNSTIPVNQNSHNNTIKNEASILHGIDPENVLFIASADNYIDVYFIEGVMVRHKLIRSTLDNAGQNLTELTHLTRCHRSYIVNLNHIESAKGNAAGFRLKINGIKLEVPVSRKYVKLFSELVAN
jgi:hypothetical protein